MVRCSTAQSLKILSRVYRCVPGSSWNWLSGYRSIKDHPLEATNITHYVLDVVYFMVYNI